MTRPKLSLRGVRVRRGRSEIVNVPHLDVAEGEVFVIIGPNGAGKSVLLETLALLQRPTEGRVLFEGEPVARRGLALRRRMAVVFQDPLLLRGSVAQNVTLGMRLRGVPRRVRRERAAFWMQRFGIAHLANRSASTLSGGEAQRAGLARAFVLEPEVLLLDEPFSALDAPTRQEILDDLSAALAETGVTTVFVTHDRDEAMRLGGRMAVLMNGEIRQVAPTMDVFASPVDREVAAFVGVETIVPGRVEELNDGLAAVDVAGRRLEIASMIEAGRDVFVCLRPEDVVLTPADGPPGPSSARNHLPAVVERTVNVGFQVRVELDAGFPLVVLITRQSLEELSLGPGSRVAASFKATAAHLILRHGR